MADIANVGALSGLRVLDLSRVLAGPWSTQILADLGAEVIKIENPNGGDDTRVWGPPFIEDQANNRRDAAYYTCANRNKSSVCIDFSKPEGAAIVRQIAEDADIVVENFKLGGLKKYGLDYESLKKINPSVIYCSVTGFSQDGPYAPRPGYDFLVQGMGGLMSITGYSADVQGGEPLKAGVAVCDLFTGMYATVSILAALNHRNQTGEGQHLDVSLLGAQVAMLANQAAMWLVGQAIPPRMGNKHPSVVPYQVFPVADGHIVITCGNNRQFTALTEALGVPELAIDARFVSNEMRIQNRDDLERLLTDKLIQHTRAEILGILEAKGVPAGPINTIPDVFADPQVQSMNMRIDLLRPDGETVPTVAFPVKMSATPAEYKKAPPVLGQDTHDVLSDMLELSDSALNQLKDLGVIN